MKNEGMDEASTIAYYKGLVEEFVQEIALMSQLKGHVNIVGYEDYAVVEHKNDIGWDIIIRMELLTALPTYIKEHSFSVDDVVKLAIDICSALEVCHKQKIIHRDIKPDNIFVSKNGDYKLGDFGVARTIEKTVSGLSKKGTYTYMAPEVYRGEQYGVNVDLYSLGIVMYKLLNNNREPFLPPYPAVINYSDKNEALVRRMRGEQILLPDSCDELLGRVISKSLSFNSWERYQSPAQMKMDLQLVENSMTSGAVSNLEIAYFSNNTYYMNKSLTNGNTNNNVYVFGTDSQNSKHLNTVNNVSKRNKILKRLAEIIGWTGALFWLLISLETTEMILLVGSCMVVVAMILLCVKKLYPYHKIFSVVMLIFSACTYNVLNILSSILYLCIKNE